MVKDKLNYIQKKKKFFLTFRTIEIIILCLSFYFLLRRNTIGIKDKTVRVKLTRIKIYLDVCKSFELF